SLSIAYIIGGLTFIPVLFLIVSIIWIISGQIVLPIYAKLHTTKNSNTKSETILEQIQEEVHSPLYKIGWLRVSRQGEERISDATIGDIVKSYISGKRNNNLSTQVAFAVLKYNTLYLYDSEKQLDCKRVIILTQYSVSIHPPGLQDYELYSKPHLIKLSHESEPPYFLNCSKCVDKEDWYFALIRATKYQMPNCPLQQDATHFDQSAMNNLITSVHSDEHHFQTQWFNAILGRLFCGVYKTEDIKTALYKKVITKLDKINAKRPPFLGEITVRSVDPGHSLPQFTQPKLLGLSPLGELTAEASLAYNGKFRIEISTVLKWKYSDRLRPLTIDLILGITLEEIVGKFLLKIKEPPTNRFWYGFYELPKMKWKVEPVVWEKRVGYSVVVKAIEQKIQEFIMETMVLPHMDDITFFQTHGVGGIFESPPDITQDNAESIKEKDAALLSSAKSLPELFSAVPDKQSLLSSTTSRLRTQLSDQSPLLSLKLTCSHSTVDSISETQGLKLRKSASLAMLRAKTVASTAVNVSPAMAYKSNDKKITSDS
ncbi:hypothetical protein K501DRAFT_125940, partial [Backusella circina FSU 941]